MFKFIFRIFFIFKIVVFKRGCILGFSRIFNKFLSFDFVFRDVDFIGLGCYLGIEILTSFLVI